jgi:hypothetical protein
MDAKTPNPAQPHWIAEKNLKATGCETRTQPVLSARAEELLKTSALRIGGHFSAARLWEEVLTPFERQCLGGELPPVWRQLGTAGIWQKLRGVSPKRAVVEVAAELGLLDAPRVRWLLRQLGEVTDDPVAAIEAARNASGLVLVEQPRSVYWMGRPIEVDWERHTALWRFFWELCRRAKAGRPLDPLDLSESAHLDSIAKQKFRLLSKVGFPVDLGDLIKPAGRRTQKLHLSPQEIRLFEVICVERVKEWTA